MRISDWSSDVCSSVLLVLRTIAYGQYPFPFLLGERLGAGFACRTLTPVSEGVSTAPAAQRPVRDAQHTVSLVRACASCHSVVNQHDGHLFHRLGDQSSSPSPQMAWAFFDNVSNAAASASARSLRSSSFSSLRLFLRSAVSCALSAEVLPASIASNACFQASDRKSTRLNSRH